MPAPATWVHAPGGWCGLLRMPDLWQIAVPLPDDESDEAALEERALRARLARFLPFGATVLPLVAREVQPVRRQVAGTYAAGRVLLAGDAAHQAQTRSGLNMNCGLHDAMAAAEALAAALHRSGCGRRGARPLCASAAAGRRRPVAALCRPRRSGR